MARGMGRGATFLPKENPVVIMVAVPLRNSRSALKSIFDLQASAQPGFDHVETVRGTRTQDWLGADIGARRAELAGRAVQMISGQVSIAHYAEGSLMDSIEWLPALSLALNLLQLPSWCNNTISVSF